MPETEKKKRITIEAVVDPEFKTTYTAAWRAAGFDNEANCTRFLVRKFIKESKNEKA